MQITTGTIVSSYILYTCNIDFFGHANRGDIKWFLEGKALGFGFEKIR